LAVVTRGTNGTGTATVSTEYVEVQLYYRMDADDDAYCD
jgi:hypothetical protein